MAKLQSLLKAHNVATKVKAERLKEIADDVIENYKFDKQSRKNWEDKSEAAIKLAEQMLDKKDFPWEGASNTCYPILTVASQSFAARVYPEIIKGPDLVKCFVVGSDPDGQKAAKAAIVADHMSYQRLIESDTWEKGVDDMLHILPIIGTCFKKVYYSQLDGTVNADLCDPQDIIVNHNEISLEKAERVTHRYTLTKREVIERIRSNLFRDVPIDGNDNMEERWKTREDTVDFSDPTKTTKIEILEQHCFIDLDDDDYPEPWIVIVCKSTSEVLAIYPRFDTDEIMYTADGAIACIHPINYFVDYHFIPAPDGGFYSLGYGHVLYTLLETINTLNNQLVDAGTLGNTTCGLYTKSLKIKGGQLKLQQGEFKEADVALTGGKLADQIWQPMFNQPSPVTLQLLTMLMEFTKEITSISDVTSGNALPQNAPAQSMAEATNQGLKINNALYKRFYRSMKKEYKLIYKFNQMYLPEYTQFQYNGKSQMIGKSDYNKKDLDICPVADPSLGADMRTQMQANTLIQMMQTPAFLPEMKIPSVIQLIAESMKLPKDKVQSLFLTPEEKQQMAQNQPPNPDMLKLQLMKEKSDQDFQIKQMQAQNAATEIRLKAIDAKQRYEIKNQETDEKQAKLLGEADVKHAEATLKRKQAENLDHQLYLDQQRIEVEKEKLVNERESLRRKPVGE